MLTCRQDHFHKSPREAARCDELEPSNSVLSVPCSFCDAAVGARCVKGTREMYDLRRSHSARFDALNGNPVVMCKNGCGQPCPPAKLHGRRLFCSDECRSAFWSTPPYDRPLVTR